MWRAADCAPRVYTVVNETVEQLNLGTLGVETASFPPVAGPFNFFDARAARVTEAVDLVRLRTWPRRRRAVRRRSTNRLWTDCRKR